MTSIIGTKYGKLTAVSIAKRKGRNNQKYLHCQCDCGKETEVRMDNFSSGHTLSCGCNHKISKKSKKITFVISNRPGDTSSVSPEKKAEGTVRRRIEDILAARALKQELAII